MHNLIFLQHSLLFQKQGFANKFQKGKNWKCHQGHHTVRNTYGYTTIRKQKDLHWVTDPILVT